MHDAVEDFIEHLRRSKFAPVAPRIESVLREGDLAADTNPHNAALFEGIAWICGHTHRSLAERIEALDKLIHHDGSLISMQAFTGWVEPE